jgi:Peptidase family S51
MYLCSYRIAQPQALEELVGKPLRDCTATVINNSKDRRTEHDRNAKNAAGLEYWNDITVGKSTMMSLLDYPSTEQMVSDMTSRDLLVFLGGDNEALRQAMIVSGFDSVAQKILQSVVFVGESAGAIVVGPNLSLFREYSRKAGFLEPSDTTEGLGLIDEIIFPHEDSTDPRYSGQGTEMALSNPDKRIVPLGDLQAFVINGLEKTIVGQLG